jgi:hypothetical protein
MTAVSLDKDGAPEADIRFTRAGWYVAYAELGDSRLGSRKDREPVDVVINDKDERFATDDVTGRQLKEKANIPLNYSLYRRHHGENEPICDNERVELHEGERFFSRPPSNVS